MKILAIIPARAGSKGVPGKNKKLLNGKPLIQYSIETALAAKGVSKLLISSDDEEIIELGKKLGAEAPFKRPAELSLDKTPTLPVVQHALNWLADNGEMFDAVCLLQPTSPFRSTELIENAINNFLESGADSLISVLPVPHEFNPHWVFEPDKDGLLHIATGDTVIIPRRQELPRAFFRDGAIYITKASVILNQNSLYGGRITYIENEIEQHVNIDTPKDWELAEAKAKQNPCAE